MGGERWDEQVGSVADEATRLLEILRRSARDAAAAEDGGPAGQDARGQDGAPAQDDAPVQDGGAESPWAEGPRAAQPAPHDPFCTWCPLCRSAAVLRSLSPETLVRLADLAGVAATVLADLASARARAAGEGPTTEDGPAGREPAATAGTSAQPIPVVDDDPQEAPRG